MGEGRSPWFSRRPVEPRYLVLTGPVSRKTCRPGSQTCKGTHSLYSSVKPSDHSVGNNLCVHQHVAYKYYLKSAERGHSRAAVFLADVWATGIPGYVERRPSDAVSLATSTLFNHTSCTPLLKPSLTLIMNTKSDRF